jgi:hypothetical protein
MSKTPKIKYNIFSSRKNFNIINWIRSSTEKTYNSFVLYLNNRNIIPPNAEYFEKALDYYNKQFKSSIIEEPVVVIEEPVVVIEEPVVVIEEPAVVIEEPSKKTKRRRRTKKVQTEE